MAPMSHGIPEMESEEGVSVEQADEEDELTADNSRILDQWDRYVCMHAIHQSM